MRFPSHMGRSKLSLMMFNQDDLEDDDPILALFANDEQGAYYDTQDLSTMFQDSAGTTPAVVGQVVGLHLDKRLGLVPGAELLTNTSFDSAIGWTLGAGWTISGGQAIHSGGTAAYISQGVPVADRWYLCVVDVATADGSNFPQLYLGDAPATASMLSPGVYTFRAKANGSAVGFALRGVGNCVINSFSVKELPGNHRFQNTTASKPILQQNASGHYYLQYDGFDDFLQTGSINFTGTDALTLWAGVRKLSDAAGGTLAELSTQVGVNNGSFLMRLPQTNGVAVSTFYSRGTALASANDSGLHPSPASMVLAVAADISADSITLRVNGAEEGVSVQDQGTGNYGNYPMYMGRRAGTSLPFAGYEFSAVVRGATTDSTTIAAIESFINSYTKAY